MKSLKTLILEMLSEEVDPEGEIKTQKISRQRAIALAIVEKAMRGDLPAVNFIRDLTDSKSPRRSEGEQIIQIRVID